MQIIDQADHDIMFEAERPSHTPSVREFCTREYFLAAHAGLPSIGLAVDGKCIGGVYMDCGFIHISVLPEYHGQCSLVYGRGLAWAFKHADPIYAEISKSNSKCIRFAEHSGWEKVGSYGGVVYYRSTKKLQERIAARRRRRLPAQATAAPPAMHVAQGRTALQPGMVAAAAEMEASDG
ncbi:hypothetical protein [Collimonas humicola]|uniref:hypothetical protein n=1 Tax=Collimonas humicola TaxID=2825886 RepID=UPI001B8C501A|nr:hypothetical protein [Collimonas humicola]